MLQVNLNQHSYNIIIERGALQKVSQWVANLWQPQRITIITDDNVAPLYLNQVEQDLSDTFEVSSIVVPAGEKSKSLDQAATIYEQLAKNGLTRSDGIIALGGGVIGDLAGYVASTYMRGVHFLQIPTTLLAQVDSSIGGKTAVNTQSAKNLVGTFAQPDGVLIDPDVLKTLDERRVREGIAEIIKSAAIADPVLWEQLDQLQDENALLEHAEAIITATLKIKKKVVEEDEFDHGNRLTLNFGHTIGHALENTSGYQAVSHGEGVAMGMVMINRQAEAKGLSPKGSTDALIAMIQKYHLPTEPENIEPQRIFQAITHDKKARGTQLKIILLEKIGQAKIVSIPIEEMKEYLKEA